MRGGDRHLSFDAKASESRINDTHMTELRPATCLFSHYIFPLSSSVFLVLFLYEYIVPAGHCHGKARRWFVPTCGAFVGILGVGQLGIHQTVQYWWVRSCSSCLAARRHRRRHRDHYPVLTTSQTRAAVSGFLVLRDRRSIGTFNSSRSR